MARLVIDLLFAHSIDMTITAEQVAARRDEWHKLATARFREEYIKGVAEFAGVDLLDYGYADLRFDLPTGNWTLKLRSKLWLQSQLDSKPHQSGRR